MSGLKLRDYQRECINAVFLAWYRDGLTRPAAVLPTGAGKTVVFSHLIQQWRGSSEEIGELGTRDLREKHGERVIVLAHRDELVDQAINKIRSTLPDSITVGKVKARSNEITADVMVCSVQTLASKRRREQLQYGEISHGEVGLIITDECHHAAARSYQDVYEAFPNALQLGVTATLARGDGVGLGLVWEEVVYTRSILWMISKNFLCDVKAVQVTAEGLDLDGVRKSRGDYAVGALGEALEDSEFAAQITSAYRQHGGDRPGIVFTPTVPTAFQAAEAMAAGGIRTAVITGDTPRDDRRAAYEAFREGSVQALVNCMVLTEGFDAPWASCAVIARPTQSAPLYTQMVGRVLRTWPNKRDALVIDLVGASANKLRTLVDLEPGAVEELREGETLAEAILREAEEGDRIIRRGSVAFDLKAREVDMFAGSKSAWNSTRAGILFIDCGPEPGTRNQRRVFLWPMGDGLWRVAGQKDGKQAGFWDRWDETDLTAPMDLSMAMAWGEVIAEDNGLFSTMKSARWRKGVPSEGQVSFAQNMGINTEGLDKGALSDALSVVTASRALDGFVKRLEKGVRV